MYAQWLVCFLLFISIITNRSTETTVIHIGGLFDSEHPSIDNGRRDIRAAKMAIDDINSRHQDLFQGLYTLKLLPNNSRCDPVYAVDAFFYAIFRRSQLHFLVGTSCSNETKAVMQVADFYNLILFSHSTAFISQVNKSYSGLVRLSVSDENYNDARVAFIKHNNWSHVAIIHQDSIEHSLMMAQLAKHLNESNINVIFTQSASWLNLTSALKNLREKKARIVFVNFDTSSRAIFFCEVYRTFSKQLRERYVWILTGNDFNLWNISMDNCTRQEILESAHGHIIIDSAYQTKPNLINPNITAYQLEHRLHVKDHLDKQTLHAYDAMWVIALLIQASIEQKIPVGEFTYASEHIRNSWLRLIEQIHFLGVSGPVSFRNRQRRAETVISQFQADSIRPRVRIIAEYSQKSGFNMNCSQCHPLFWPSTIPVDTERSEVRRVALKVAEIIFITVASILGLALAVLFLTFNIIYRHERYIKLSSPKLNNVMLIGAMHIHIAILLFGFDEWFLKHNILGHSCILRIFLFSGGFSLTFGSMFLKTLRVYRIFTSNDRPLLHSKLLKDYYLLLICFYLYGIDAIVIIIWQYLDPHYIEFGIGSVRRLDMDTVVSDQIHSCNSHYRQKILPFIYFYKSLFLIVGGYLAAKTRHVHISALNDSKFIVWSIYIVVLTSLFTVIIMISIQNLLSYVVLCFAVIIMTSVIICLVFLPKVLKLRNRHREDIVSKDLYMGDSGTRRLAGEISCFEAYRYAQLQNRELKTELLRLTQTFNSLQQRLEAISSNVTMALLPLAVRLATTFLQTPDFQPSHSRLNSKASVEITSQPKEETTDVTKTIDENTLNDTTSSISVFENLERKISLSSSSSSSSEYDPSNAQLKFNDNSSLSLTSFDIQESLTPENDDEADENDLLMTMFLPSDDESVLYLCISDELNVAEATLESDFDQLGQL